MSKGAGAQWVEEGTMIDKPVNHRLLSIEDTFKAVGSAYLHVTFREVLISSALRFTCKARTW